MKKVFSLIIVLAVAVGNLNAQITLTGETGWLETACVTWLPVADAASYNVYYSSGQGINNQQIDTQLIRSYGSYMRADVLGLAAGSYTITVKAVDSAGAEFETATSQPITVQAHDRSGFAFATNSPAGTASGAYNNDGTLRANAQVIYLTNNTATTVTLSVKTSANGAITACTGIGAILKARQKGYDQTPLTIRIIGKVTQTALSASEDALGSDDDLQCKGKANVPSNITIEGVGEDATAYGWGILVRNSRNVELRNIGFMNFPEDGVSLNTDNDNIWVHHCDFYYGKNGGGDKDKGDGSLDSKESGYVTISYNHFWDSGKCNLLGNGTEDPEYLTYHHNWYDHSDSRHPRVRFHRVHSYNNYFDGNSKYGIGAAAGCPSIFSENNYFHNCKAPMLISKQGSDIAGGSGGTFSNENGGMIKAYNNHIDGATRYVPYSATNSVEFDAYEVANRTNQVPGSVTSKQGGCTYLNFDTDATIMGASVYPCTITPVDNVPAVVMAGAGRMNGSDLQFTFTDADNSVDTPVAAIVSAINNYTSQLVAIQGESDNGQGQGGGDTGGGDTGGEVEGAIGGALCALKESQTPTGFTITGNTSDSKGSVIYNGTTYSCCLKMEGSTSISFTTTATMNLTLVFGGSTSANGKKVKINGTNYTLDATEILTETLEAGTHTVTKGDAINLFYISLAPNTTTGNVSNSTLKTAIKINYYNVAGQKVSAFTNNQLIIRETIFDDGSAQREKILIKKN
ncbi:hypothetical protein FACS1894180_6780 [Bacteroidia bacterium]|nr:hypothetical protein FACS1894180_6780 [Bacteroidia bacterium]